jgi:ferritin-like metal-binding protein YciE
MAKKRISKTRTRKNVSTFTKRRGKRLTPSQKLTLHLNEALAIENAAVQRLQSRIKQTRLENVKQRLQVHLEETKGQQNRLKQLVMVKKMQLQKIKHNCQFLLLLNH